MLEHEKSQTKISRNTEFEIQNFFECLLYCFTWSHLQAAKTWENLWDIMYRVKTIKELY